MRIIGGRFKGRRIKIRGNLSVRPTTDFAKEGLFNVLNNKIEFDELKVLDLFSGTGMMSLEFISRGASNVVAVDKSIKCNKYINRVIKDLGIDNLSVIHSEVTKFCCKCNDKYDLIFADPPYDSNILKDLPQYIIGNNMISGSGILIIEHPKSVSFAEEKFFTERRVYGKVNFSLFTDVT